MTAPSRRGIAAKAASLLGVLGALTGCGELPDPAHLITRNRVLAVRVERADDPTQSRPAPGETFRARPFVAGPVEGTGPVRWRIEACPAAPDGGGWPRCAGAVFADAEGVADRPDDALVAVAPPLDALHPEVRAVLLRGVACTDGTPAPGHGAEDLPTCAPGATDEERFFATVAVVDPTDPHARNHQPRLADATLALDGVAWAAGAAPPGPDACAAAADTAALPRLRPGEERTLSVEIDPAEREVVDDEGTRETLQLTHLVTGGELSRTFSVLEGAPPNAGRERVALTLTAPEEDVPAGGQVVRALLVARDGRGGVDWTERSLCVVPPNDGVE